MDDVTGLVMTTTRTAGGFPLPVSSPYGTSPELSAARQQAIIVPDTPVIRIANEQTAFTCAFRVNHTTLISSAGVVCKANLGANNTEFFIIYQPGVGLRARINTLPTVTQCDQPASPALATGAWMAGRVWLDPVLQTWNMQIGNGTIVSASLAGKTFTPTNPTLELGQHGSYLDAVVGGTWWWDRVLPLPEWTSFNSDGPSGTGMHFPFVVGGSSLRVNTVNSYCVYQRNAWGFGLGTADITVAGTYQGSPTQIEARFNGGSWTVIDAAPANGKFSGTLTCPVGQGNLEVRFKNTPGVIRVIPMVGVGDVIVGIGQSNMSGRVVNFQAWVNATFTACLLGNDGTFKVLSDPWDSGTNALQNVNLDIAARGSYIPHIATAWMADQGCPVMFVPACMGGTAISAWQPTADHLDQRNLFGAFIARAKVAKPGFIIMHQGENDALIATTTTNYKNALVTLGDTAFAELGVPIYCAKLHTYAENATNLSNIRAGIDAAAAQTTSIKVGPDFTSLSEVGMDIHFLSDINAQTAGQMWFARIKAIKEA